MTFKGSITYPTGRSEQGHGMDMALIFVGRGPSARQVNRHLQLCADIAVV